MARPSSFVSFCILFLFHVILRSADSFENRSQTGIGFNGQSSPASLIHRLQKREGIPYAKGLKEGERIGDSSHHTSGCRAFKKTFERNFILTGKENFKEEAAKDVYVYREIVAPGNKIENLPKTFKKTAEFKEQMKLDVVQFQVQPIRRENLAPVSADQRRVAKETLAEWKRTGVIPPTGAGYNSNANEGFRLDNQAGLSPEILNLQLQQNGVSGRTSVAHVQVPLSVVHNPNGVNYVASALRYSLRTGNPVYIYAFSENAKEFETRSVDPAKRPPYQP